MFGKILYASDNVVYIENKLTQNSYDDLLNYHLIFESNNQKILGEIVEITNTQMKVNLLGEFVLDSYRNGILRKVSLSANIRVINASELQELIGIESKDTFLLGRSGTYKNFSVYPKINNLFSSHMCIFGNSGSGKSCGVARIIQNVLENKNYLVYNANLLFFDSFGEYKNAFKSINSINQYYNYKFVTTNVSEQTDIKLSLPLNLLTIDDLCLLLQANKHTQYTILENTAKHARIFASSDANAQKNYIIANAILSVIYSSDSTRQKRDNIFQIINVCHTDEFNFDTPIAGIGYTRKFSECFTIDSKGRFSEEVLILDYILKYSEQNFENYDGEKNAVYTLEAFYNALEFTLISEGFNNNNLVYDDAQILKVRLHTLINSTIGKIFTGDKYYTREQFLTELLKKDNTKAQIININLDGLDDNAAKAIVKIYLKIVFDYCKENTNRASVPFHLFLEEAHRYIQKDADVFLLGYNIFDRIAKEGRKYGVFLDIISQRPVELSETVIAQCSNFLIYKMTHPKDVKYIGEMLPNISSDILEKIKVLQPGTCVAFGSAFKIPMIIKMDMPKPSPYSSNCNVSFVWDLKNDNETKEIDNAAIEVNNLN